MNYTFLLLHRYDISGMLWQKILLWYDAEVFILQVSLNSLCFQELFCKCLYFIFENKIINPIILFDSSEKNIDLLIVNIRLPRDFLLVLR